MLSTPNVLYLFPILGLLFAAGLAMASAPRARTALLALGLALVIPGALAVLSAAFLVSRLDGSRPPGLLDFLAPQWLPLALTGLACVLMIALYRRKPPV